MAFTDVPVPEIAENTVAFLTRPMIRPTGFREYDARWRYPEEINLVGVQALGLGLATQLHELGLPPVVVTGNDYRSYSLEVKQALALGLMAGGAQVLGIGVALSPMAYFAQFDLEAQAVAMVTASHNTHGWTGVKMGFERPLTHGPAELARLRRIVRDGRGQPRGAGWVRAGGGGRGGPAPPCGGLSSAAASATRPARPSRRCGRRRGRRREAAERAGSRRRDPRCSARAPRRRA